VFVEPEVITVDHLCLVTFLSHKKYSIL
jgi:hypothetical protein